MALLLKKLNFSFTFINYKYITTTAYEQIRRSLFRVLAVCTLGAVPILKTMYFL